MKILNTVLLLLITVSVAMANSNASHVHVISTKTDIFYFRVDKSFMGAIIEVYSQGNLIRTDTVMHRRNILDFYLDDPGTYQIRIKKDGGEAIFQYEKTEFMLESRISEPLANQK
jgi:hypothetical protein